MGGRGRSLHCHHQNDSCIKVGSDESYFNVSLIVRNKVTGLLGTGRGGRGRSLHCHHKNDSCIKMGSDESHFNVSVGSDGQSHKPVSTNHNLSEGKGEPK